MQSLYFLYFYIAFLISQNISKKTRQNDLKKESYIYAFWAIVFLTCSSDFRRRHVKVLTSVFCFLYTNTA